MTTTSDHAPFVPTRRSGWPVRQVPIWVWLLVAVVVAGGVTLVSIAQRPSHAQQAADLTSYMHDMNAAVESCAGGVTESRQAFDAVTAAGFAASPDFKAAVSLTTYNASNCVPANNQLLADLTQYQVTESLARFHLANTTDDYVTWSFDAAQVQDDMVSVLRASGPAARSSATATLQRDTAKLDAERAVIDGSLRSAERAVSDTAALPALPG
jgi:hypothetical protein